MAPRFIRSVSRAMNTTLGSGNGYGDTPKTYLGEGRRASVGQWRLALEEVSSGCEPAASQTPASSIHFSGDRP